MATPICCGHSTRQGHHILKELEEARSLSQVPLTLVINRMRVFANGRNSAQCSARVRLIRLKVGAGGCGGCGLVAAPDITAMGIESFLVCSLLILLDLGKSEENENRS